MEGKGKEKTSKQNKRKQLGKPVVLILLIASYYGSTSESLMGSQKPERVQMTWDQSWLMFPSWQLIEFYWEAKEEIQECPKDKASSEEPK